MLEREKLRGRRGFDVDLKPSQVDLCVIDFVLDADSSLTHASLSTDYI